MTAKTKLGAPVTSFTYRKAKYRDEDHFTPDHPLFAHPEIAKPGEPTIKFPTGRYHPITTDREALERLVEQADVLEVEERTFLLIEATPPLWDFLVTFGADREDLEDDDPRGPDYRDAPYQPGPGPGPELHPNGRRWYYPEPLADKQVRTPDHKDTGTATAQRSRTRSKAPAKPDLMADPFREKTDA